MSMFLSVASPIEKIVRSDAAEYERSIYILLIFI